MATLPYLSTPPDGANFNALLAEFDRRLGLALAGCSPLVPCVRGFSIDNNAALNALWTDMFDRSHDLLGYRFSFPGAGDTPYHDLAALQVGAWPAYDHAALTAIANAATVLVQDDDLGLVVVPSNADTQKLEGSLECHTREITSGDYAGEFYPLAITARPQRRHEHAVAELLCEGRTTFTVPRTWNRFGCFRIHNLSRDPLTVTVQKVDPLEADDVFTVKGFGVRAVRRADDGYYDRSLTYWWKWRNTRERPVFLEAAGVTTPGLLIPEQSCRANPITRLMGLLDWLLHCGAQLDPRELPDLSAQFPMFAGPTATVFGDMIHFRGDVWAIGYPTDSAGPPEIRKGAFRGYGTLVADFAELGVTVTESGGVYTLSRAAEDAPGDAAHGLDVFTPGSNLLHGPDFHVFRTLPYVLESWVPLHWPVVPFTAELTSTPRVVKTLTNTVTGDYAETYTEASVPVDRMVVATKLIWRVTYFEKSETTGVAIVTLAEAHSLTVGQWVRVEITAIGYAGTVQVTVVPSPTTFRFNAPFSGAYSLATGGRVTGAPSRHLLDDAPALPAVDGVEWSGTWRLTPCGWRASWTYELALEAPGILTGVTETGLLDGLYDDVDEDGIATHRGTVEVLGQGWPLDDSATPLVAGTGTRHALTPDYPRRYRQLANSVSLGLHDPGFTGYLGRPGGGDLQPATRTATTYDSLRSLRTLATFVRTPATNAATHRVGAILDSAHVPIVQETVACSDPASIFGQRAALRTETATAASVGPAWHYLPVAPWRYNLLAWHVNAWTRTAPLCTVLDVIAGDYLVGETVCRFTLGSLCPNYYGDGVVGGRFPGVGTVPRGFVSEVGEAYLPALAAIGLPVQTEAAFAAQIAAIDAALAAPVKSLHWKQTTTEVDAEFVQTAIIYGIGSGGLEDLPLGWRFSLRRTLRSTLSVASAPGSFDATPLADEADHATDIKTELEGWTHWIRASDLKELADDWQLPFVFEQAGHPVRLFTAASEMPALLRPESTWATGERTEAWSVNLLQVLYDNVFPGSGTFYPHSALPIPAPPLPDGSLPANGTSPPIAGHFKIFAPPFGEYVGDEAATREVPYTWSGDPTNIDTGTHVGATQTTNVAGAMVRWQPVETAGACEFLGEASGAFSAAQAGDGLYAPFDWDNQRGGPWQTPRVGDPVWLLRRGDNPPGGFSPSSLIGPPFPTPVRTSSPAAQAISDGRPAAIRAIDRELNRAYAIETATHDPSGKLVRATRLLAWKAYDLNFNAAWLTDSAANLALGPHAIPRTLTAGSGLVTAEVVADGITVLAPPEGETGVWEVGVRHATYLDLS